MTQASAEEAIGMKVARSAVKVNKLGGPLPDRETKDLVDVEAPRNRRERRAAAAWKRKQSRER